MQVVHFVSSTDTGKREIPLLLSGEKLSTPSNNGVETATDLNKSPDAVVLGLGFTNATVDELRDACKDVLHPVPWVSGGLSQREFSGVVGAIKPPAEEGPLWAELMKKVLRRIKGEGKFGKDGVYHWWDKSQGSSL